MYDQLGNLGAHEYRARLKRGAAIRSFYLRFFVSRSSNPSISTYSLIICLTVAIFSASWGRILMTRSAIFWAVEKVSSFTRKAGTSAC